MAWIHISKPMRNLLSALKTAIVLARADIPESDRYDLFAEAFRRDRYAYVLTENEVKSAYFAWRMNTLGNKQSHAHVLQTVFYMSSHPRRKLILVALALGVLALLFPPFQLSTASQSIYLGFGFVFSSQLGQISSGFLVVELAAIGLGYLLIDRYLTQALASAADELSQN